MIPAERQKLILKSLAEHEILSIAELMKRLDVSHMTVRRDIQKLEEEGRVLSVSGGVCLAQKITFEPSHLTKRTQHHAEKMGIATVAAALVAENASIYLDAGTTSLAIAEKIACRNDLMVVTNDFIVAAYLIQNSACRLYHTGGQVVRENQSCVGESAARFLHGFNLDLAFVSASSWNTRWISTPTESKVAIKKALITAAAKRILVSDSSKYGKIGVFNAIPISAIQMIITDDGLAEGARETFHQMGVDIRLVPAQKDDDSGATCGAGPA